MRRYGPEEGQALDVRKRARKHRRWRSWPQPASAAKSILWRCRQPPISVDELLKMLDCKEQQQAATATDKAIRGGVGTEVSWKSEDRPNVSGTSKVTAAAGVG